VIAIYGISAATTLTVRQYLGRGEHDERVDPNLLEGHGGHDAEQHVAQTGHEAAAQRTALTDTWASFSASQDGTATMNA
jgi:hypothetical protein